MLMSAKEYEESLRQYKPKVFVDGRRVESVVDEPAFRPGVNAVGLTLTMLFGQNMHQS